MTFVVDTHALVWWLTHSPRLSKAAQRALERARRTGPIYVSAISLFEVTCLSRGPMKLGIPVDRWIAAACSLPEVKVEPVGREIAELAGGISEDVHGDPADRIIVATAIHLGATIITADAQMHRGHVPTLW